MEEVEDDTLLLEEWDPRDVMTKRIRGRRERGNRVGSTASHWISLILPVETQEGSMYNTIEPLTNQEVLYDLYMLVGQVLCMELNNRLDDEKDCTAF